MVKYLFVIFYLWVVIVFEVGDMGSGSTWPVSNSAPESNQPWVHSDGSTCTNRTNLEVM